MKSLITIMCHGEALDTFDRHFPFWKSLESQGAELLFVMPEDDPFKIPGYNVLKIGLKNHHGVQSIKRFWSILDHMSRLEGFGLYGFMEYDSIYLGKLTQIINPFAGNIFLDNITEQFKGGMFVHPPFFTNAAAILELVKTMSKIPFTEEGSFWDRYLGRAISESDLRYEDFKSKGLGFSANTIEPDMFPALRKAVYHGAVAIHGIKTKEALNVLLAARKHRAMQEELESIGYQIELPEDLR